MKTHYAASWLLRLLVTGTCAILPLVTAQNAEAQDSPAPTKPAPLQTEKKYPIDLWVEKQQQKDPSTRGMREAVIRGRAMWDAELNKVYQRLMRHLNSTQRTALQKSEKAWLAFRDAEFEASAQILARRQGTIWLVVHDGHLYDVVKARTLQLQEYLPDTDQ